MSRKLWQCNGLKATALFLVLAVTGCHWPISEQETEVSISVAPKTQSASVRPDRSDLDLLSDYNRDLWDGPDGWTDEQWHWKKRLQWDKECDYVGEVTLFLLSDRIQLVQVMCVPGAYQSMYYLYLYDSEDRSSKQLALGTLDSAEDLYQVWGRLEFDSSSKQLTVLTLARGMGDCGSYRVFSFDNSREQPELVEHRAKRCETHPQTSGQTPSEWPMVD